MYDSDVQLFTQIGKNVGEMVSLTANSPTICDRA